MKLGTLVTLKKEDDIEAKIAKVSDLVLNTARSPAGIWKHIPMK